MNRRLIIGAVVALLLLVPVTVSGHVPPGNDGGFCHGANKETCRPDPQPLHGQDCLPHGHNQDGNDDHCAATPTVAPTPTATPTTTPSEEPSTAPTPTPTLPTVTPTPTPTEQPTPTPSTTPSERPSATPTGVDTGGGPQMTLPPTDTE